MRTRNILIAGGIIGAGLLAFAGLASAAESGSGNLDAGASRGGKTKPGATPEEAGKIPKAVLDQNSNEIVKDGLLPGALYLAGANVFFRGWGLIAAHLAGVTAIPVRLEALRIATGLPLEDNPALVLVATRPGHTSGSRVYSAILYPDEDPAELETASWYPNAIAWARGQEPGEA